jgi:EmrB/QacA subfamily drug resistance transporter
MALGALEATVVSTAMPTVIATLGGLAHYSWVFSAYLLTSTASVPIWGRLSDLYGRRRLYLAGVVMFLIGSLLCGLATSMTQLIVFRAIQGLGAGAVIPLSMTIVGELYTLQERPRVQALFSGVWGFASITGPLVGGYITDVLSWPWVFYLNLPFGVVASVVIAMAYPKSEGHEGATIDWAGATLLFASVTTLLVALSDATASPWPWVAATAAMVPLLIAVERRAGHPILPLDLFRNRMMSRSLVTIFIVGTVMYGAIAFVPLFVQAVLGGSATEAGQMLTPLFLGWVTMSVVGAKLTVKLGYRPMVTAGTALITVGFVSLAMLDANTSRLTILMSVLPLGCGLGLSWLSLLLAVQHGVPRSQLGIATSLNQFFRSIGSAAGVAIMGAILARGMAGISMGAAGHGMAAGDLDLDTGERVRVAAALAQVFTVATAVSALAMISSFFLPPVDFSHGVPAGAGEQMLAAEMATLEPESEPEMITD